MVQQPGKQEGESLDRDYDFEVEVQVRRARVLDKGAGVLRCQWDRVLWELNVDLNHLRTKESQKREAAKN